MSEDYADWREADGAGQPGDASPAMSPVGLSSAGPSSPASSSPASSSPQPPTQEPSGMAAGQLPDAAAGALAVAAVAATASAPSAWRPGASRAAIAGWWDRAGANLRGTVLMIAAFCFFAVMTTLIKLVGSRIPIAQILVVRQIVMTLILAAIVGRALPHVLRTNRPGLQLQRGVFSLGAMLCGFTALINMPLADATAIGFSQVLFVTLLAIFVLGEVVDWRRWVAMAVGFCGVAVMLRPGGEALNLYALLALAGALFGAGITVTVRVLGSTERTETILFWQSGFICLALAVPAWLWWTQPTPLEWALMIALAIVGTAGQWLVTRAYQTGEASALAPLDFVRLLLAVVSGYLVFAEVPGMVTIVGATLIVGATCYTMMRNTGRRRSPPPDVE